MTKAQVRKLSTQLQEDRRDGARALEKFERKSAAHDQLFSGSTEHSINDTEMFLQARRKRTKKTEERRGTFGSMEELRLPSAKGALLHQDSERHKLVHSASSGTIELGVTRGTKETRFLPKVKKNKK
jgi:hypothetical protein